MKQINKLLPTQICCHNPITREETPNRRIVGDIEYVFNSSGCEKCDKEVADWYLGHKETE